MPEDVTPPAPAPPAPVRVRESVLLSVEQLEEPPWNPNQEDSATFGALGRNIQELGFVEPLVVAPAGPAGRYRVTRGTHRLRAAKVLGLAQVPCVVVDEMTDEADQKIDTVRANVVRGALNPWKFTKLFNELRRQVDPEKLRARMELTNQSVFQRLYQDVRKVLPPEARKGLDAAKTEIRDVDDLALVVKRVFAEHGSDLQHSFIVFEFGSQKHVMIRATGRTWRNLERLMEQCRQEQTDLNAAVCQLLERDLPAGWWLAAEAGNG